MTSKKEIDDVWEKGKTIRGKNPDLYRKNPYGNTIYKPSYGKKSEMGWEIDHIKPQSKGGTDTNRNKQPVYWQENREKGDKYPYKK